MANVAFFVAFWADTESNFSSNMADKPCRQKCRHFKGGFVFNFVYES